MDKTVTFAEFEAILLRFGFQKKPAQGGQKLYEQDETTWILLPAYTSDTPVRPVHLQAARRLFSERGILDASVFDTILRGEEQTVSAA